MAEFFVNLNYCKSQRRVWDPVKPIKAPFQYLIIDRSKVGTSVVELYCYLFVLYMPVIPFPYWVNDSSYLYSLINTWAQLFKASYIFFNKKFGIFQILTFEVLM